MAFYSEAEKAPHSVTLFLHASLW